MQLIFTSHKGPIPKYEKKLLLPQTIIFVFTSNILVIIFFLSVVLELELVLVGKYAPYKFIALIFELPDKIFDEDSLENPKKARSIYFKEEQLENILSATMDHLLSNLKLDKSNDVNKGQYLNINLVLFNFGTCKFDMSNFFNEEQF